MRPHLDIAHQGTLPNNRLRMTMDEDSLSQLMSVLTDLYSDRELAVIREYATNAWDSHIEAGNPDPIEIFTPSFTSPVYVVRDRGVGMSLDDITHHFSKYGWSSKRESDEVTGMLGLGCKSALTLASQFTMVSTHNGLRVTVLITRESDGAGALQIIDTAATDEPNGVEIRVPVNDVASFNEKVRAFFRFSTPGSVLVDGSAPESWGTDTDLVVDPDIVLTRDPDLATDYIVMGNVPYPVLPPFKVLVKSVAHMHAIVRVPIGTIKFTPSREALRECKLTSDTLQEARDYIKQRVRVMIQAEISAADTRLAAMAVARRWRGIFKDTYRWRGEEIPAKILVDAYRWDPQYLDNQSERIYDVDPAAEAGCLHVINCKTRGLHSVGKDKVLKYMDDQRMKRVTVILHREHAALSPWLLESGIAMVDWTTIRAIRLTPETKRVSKPRVSGHRVVLPGETLERRMSEFTKPAVYVDAMDQTLKHAIATILRCPVIVVPAGSKKKFHRDHPDVVHAREALLVAYEDWVNGLTDAQIARLRDGGFETWSLPNVTLSTILDPELRALVAEVRDATKMTRQGKLNSFVNLAANMGVTLPPLRKSTYVRDRINPMRDRYPAIEYVRSNHLLPHYVNNVYVASHVRLALS